MSSRRSIRPVCLCIAVGLTPRMLADPALAAASPVVRAIAARGGAGPLAGISPAVTLPAQASLLTGELPQVHGVVANGRHYRESDEIRFWLQSRRQLSAQPFYERAAAAVEPGDKPLDVAKLFAWFNQGAAVGLSVTPKPHYGADGGKHFDILTTPPELGAVLQGQLGRFPFHTFWGPMSGPDATTWIARAAAHTLTTRRPDLTITYLPVLDYDLQRFGTGAEIARKPLAALDAAVGIVHDACRAIDARLVIVSEYGILPVDAPVYLNRELRKAGLLATRDTHFGELIDVPESPVVPVVDHQVAHLTVDDPGVRAETAALLRSLPGVGDVYVGDERSAVGLDHPHAGEIVAFSEPSRWFAYPYWLAPDRAPDFAPTVDIHRKPGYDPLEMSFAPRLRLPKVHVMRRLVARRLGFRNLIDVVPVDREAEFVRGSHGVAPSDPEDGPVIVTDDAELAAVLPTELTGVAGWLERALAGA
jgi:predicted AlkP superfamily pyrophosphatase or phosphodiesterase